MMGYLSKVTLPIGRVETWTLAGGMQSPQHGTTPEAFLPPPYLLHRHSRIQRTLEFLEIMSVHCSSWLPIVVRVYTLCPSTVWSGRLGQKVGGKCWKEGWTHGREKEEEQMRGRGEEEGGVEWREEKIQERKLGLGAGAQMLGRRGEEGTARLIYFYEPECCWFACLASLCILRSEGPNSLCEKEQEFISAAFWKALQTHLPGSSLMKGKGREEEI